MKIKRFLGVLIILPILAGLFCDSAAAVIADNCISKTDCEEELENAQDDLDDLVALHEAFLDCWGGECGDCDQYTYDENTKCNSDEFKEWWEECETDKRKTEGEKCDGVYGEAKDEADAYAKANNKTTDLIALDDINKELTKERKEMGNDITALKIYLHSFKNVNVKDILKISNKDSEGKITQEQKIFSDAKSFLGGVIDLLIKMVGVAAIVFLVIGGFRLVVAAGNDNEIQKAKSMIQYAVVGLAVALLAYIIVAAVQGILYR